MPADCLAWCSMCREAIGFFTSENIVPIGGVNEDNSSKIVEIDESLFLRRKYNRGRILNNQWYVGGIERGTKNVFIVPVENRNAETMANIIQQYVLPGSTIITDKWRAYSTALEQLPNYSHQSVNHSLNFVDPNNPLVHTQNIEGLWSRSKYFLRKKKGISREQQSDYLIQFLWEYKVEKKKRFVILLTLLQIGNF